MQVDIRSNIKEVVGWTEALFTDQLPFAVASALTATVRDVWSAESDEIAKVFEKPTPFTKRAVAYTQARKNELRAMVFLKPAQAQYLFQEIEGGKREVKKFEERFGPIGAAAVAMPGGGASVNQYGNLSKAQILKIANELNSSGGAKRYFKGTPRGHALPPGIYARVDNNTKIVPVLVFAKDATYKKRFAFSELAERTVDARFEKNLMVAWERALRTAR